MYTLFHIATYGAAFAAISLILQGCNMQKSVASLENEGSQESELQHVHELEAKVKTLGTKLQTLEKQKAQECSQKCADRKHYGRWHNAAYGHHCFTEDGESVCMCTSSQDRPAECEKPPGSLAETSNSEDADVDEGLEQASALAKLDATIAAATEANSLPTSTTANAELGLTGAPALLQSGDSVVGSKGALRGVRAHGHASADIGALSNAEEAPLPGSVRQIVGDFCDASGLKEMQGKKSSVSDADAVNSVESDSNEDSSSNQLESAIIADVANELETNNVDKMAKEIFTFYMCVRWVPDRTFYALAEQELAANIVESVVDKNQKPDQAVAELYQSFKYVPLLCSKNLVVFGEKHTEDFTYYRRFKEKVDELSSWVQKAKETDVSKRLAQMDEIFCGEGKKMNGCSTKTEFLGGLNKITDLFGHHFDTKEDRWVQLHNSFKEFEGDGGVGGGGEEWRASVQEWKSRFPYHSFISKNDGPEKAPNPDQRLLVCFGKRVASEMHRRPNGQHLLTDQNNIGCHGWWDETHGGAMLQRLATLWRPPTCQLADMTYTMKREILSMFARMNMRLFDALPTMLTDEFLKESGELEAHITGPGAYDPQHVTMDNGDKYIDEMRVSLKEKLVEPPGCADDKVIMGVNTSSLHTLHKSTKCLVLKEGSLGLVKVEDSKLKVVWDLDEDQQPLEMKPEKLKIMPHRWEAKKGFTGHMKDLVAGVGTLKNKAADMLSSMFSNDMTNLAQHMSGSVSKWVVCPVKEGVDMQRLDAHLGVEDAAFQDFQKEAYAKLTKFKAKVPGEECEKPSFLEDTKFSKAEMCEISVLHADHVEKFTYLENTPLAGVQKGDLEPFICPMKPSLPADEQLEILSQKKNKCYLHMSEEQMRHYSWLYQGKHPARRQHDRKANIPQTEFELLKLVKVSSGADSETNFGRFCTLDELATTPRFCNPPELYNPWMNLEELAESLQEVATGALGIGSSAISGAIKLYQSGLKDRSAKENALMLSEKAWDGLTGAGRLLRSATMAGVSEATDGLHGETRRAGELQIKHFRTMETGKALHSLSFQRSIGSNGTTSNAKERYQRYVVPVPCYGYDPVIRYQIDKKWGDGVLRMLKEAKKRAAEILTASTHVELTLRGEAKLFEKKNEHTNNSLFYVFQAAMQWPKPEEATEHKVKVVCSGNKLTGCRPKHQCVPNFFSCVPATQWSPSDWWAIEDQKLATYVGGRPVTTGDMDLGKIFGFSTKIYCGAKTDFKNKKGGPEPTEQKDASFLECLHRGVKENARSRALSPWKVYFPDEIVVVATFEQLVGRRCKPADGIAPKLREMLCVGNETAEGISDEHVSKASNFLDGGGEYRGLHTGAGFARGTPSEVVLRPEDILDALELLPKTS